MTGEVRSVRFRVVQLYGTRVGEWDAGTRAVARAAHLMCATIWSCEFEPAIVAEAESAGVTRALELQ